MSNPTLKNLTVDTLKIKNMDINLPIKINSNNLLFSSKLKITDIINSETIITTTGDKNLTNTLTTSQNNFTNPQNLITKKYVDDNALLKAGGTMTGAITMVGDSSSLAMGTRPITSTGTMTMGAITTNGIISPNATNTIDIGSTSTQFKDLYLSGKCNATSLTNGTASIGLTSTVATVDTGTQFAYTNFPYCAMRIASTTSPPNGYGTRLIVGSAVASFHNEFLINTTTGIITYTGKRTIPVKISVNCSITATLGENLGMYMVLNGVEEKVGNKSYLYQTCSGSNQSFVFTEVINMATNNTTQPAVYYTGASDTLYIINLCIICEAIPV